MISLVSIILLSYWRSAKNFFSKIFICVLKTVTVARALAESFCDYSISSRRTHWSSLLLISSIASLFAFAPVRGFPGSFPSLPSYFDLGTLIPAAAAAAEICGKPSVCPRFKRLPIRLRRSFRLPVFFVREVLCLPSPSLLSFVSGVKGAFC